MYAPLCRAVSTANAACMFTRYRMICTCIHYVRQSAQAVPGRTSQHYLWLLMMDTTALCIEGTGLQRRPRRLSVGPLPTAGSILTAAQTTPRILRLSLEVDIHNTSICGHCGLAPLPLYGLINMILSSTHVGADLSQSQPNKRLLDLKHCLGVIGGLSFCMVAKHSSLRQALPCGMMHNLLFVIT
jgi:hypothetical protein